MRGRRVEKTLGRECVSEMGVCSSVAGVCVGVTAGNQAGTVLVSRGCGGGRDLISNEYNYRETKNIYAKHSASLRPGLKLTAQPPGLLIARNKKEIILTNI